MRGTQFAELSAFVAVAEQPQLHQGGGPTGHFAAGAEPDHSFFGRSAWRTLSQSYHPQRGADRSGRAAVDRCAAGPRRHRPGDRARQRVPRQAKRRVTPECEPARRKLACRSPAVEFLAKFPDIKLEIAADDTHSDIVSSRFDAGIRIGERIAKDMIAVRLLEDQRYLVVASPAYLARHPRPALPEDLHAHNCVRLRSDWDGMIQSWPFENASRRLDVAVNGSLVLNDWNLVLNAVLEGIGVGYLPHLLVSPPIADGRLVRLLGDWCGQATGPFLYYPSRRQMPGALRAFIDFMRAQNGASPAAGRTAWENSVPGSQRRSTAVFRPLAWCR